MLREVMLKIYLLMKILSGEIIIAKEIKENGEGLFAIIKAKK